MKCPNCGPLGNDFCTWPGHKVPPYTRGWVAGIKALASILEDKGIHHPALENACAYLLTKGPK